MIFAALILLVLAIRRNKWKLANSKCVVCVSAGGQSKLSGQAILRQKCFVGVELKSFGSGLKTACSPKLRP